MDIDSQVVTYIAEHRAWLLDRVALATMFIGTNRGTLAVIGLVGLAIVIWLRKWRMAVAAALALVDAAGSSLPSADAAMTAAVAIAIFLAVDWPTPMVRRIAAVALIVGVFWIGFCVVYLGVHWPTDVLVGWVLGGGIGLAAASRVGRWGRPGRPPATKSTSF